MAPRRAVSTGALPAVNAPFRPAFEAAAGGISAHGGFSGAPPPRWSPQTSPPTPPRASTEPWDAWPEHGKGVFGRHGPEPALSPAAKASLMSPPSPAASSTSFNTRNSARSNQRRHPACGARRGTGRYGAGAQIDDDDEDVRRRTEAACFKKQLAKKEISIECDAQLVMGHLSTQTDHDLRRTVGKVLEDCGVPPQHLNGVRKVVMRILDSSDAQAVRDAARLFARFAESVRSRLKSLTEAEMLAATVLLAESALRATAGQRSGACSRVWRFSVPLFKPGSPNPTPRTNPLALSITDPSKWDLFFQCKSTFVGSWFL
eukprot:TRINITY_DN19692_c0_g1_i1.p1 TRINITY_DN19692_c0_g1~~TRINITY_DN19692_c0_g1_i1.p1  ORF type:complete len:337 (+),score=39.05 TRINITY_DN19692_c0_g1_i1:63-1013(+)